ncbi:tail fiber domain-containing protein [bacterium]|nr:tail fiber domain-containing protein [bacterium]
MANFTSNKINETYQRLVQVDGGTIQDGYGKILSGSMSDLTVNGVLEVTGSIRVDGTVTARSFIATQVTSSIIYESGSTRYGDTPDDEHTFTGSLNVLGDQSLDGDLYITGDTIQTGSINLQGNIAQKGDYSIFGKTTKTGDLDITGGYFQRGRFKLLGNSEQEGTNTHVGDLERNGNTSLTGNLTNNGNAIFIGDSTHTGTYNHEGTLVRKGRTELDGKLEQTGDSSQTGKSSITGSLYSKGSLTSVGTTNLINQVSINGRTDIEGSIQHTGDTDQVGNFTLQGELNITGSTEINISGSINQVGDTTQLGDFRLTGDQSLVGDLHITGDTIQTGNLNVNGVVTAKQFITDIVSSSVVYRSGDTQFGNTLDDKHTFTGDLLSTGSLTSKGNVEVTGNLEVTGSALVKNRVQANSVDSNYFMSPKVVPDTIIPPNYNMRIFHDTSITGELFISQNSDVYVPVEDGRDEPTFEHPKHDSINLSVTSGNLTGADIVSNVGIDLTTNTLGHLVNANSTISSRTLTLADLSYTGDLDANKITDNSQLINGAGFVTSSGNLIIGTDSDINATGATVVENLNMTDGVIESHSTRTLTLADLGYTGDLDANNSVYVHPSTGVQGVLVDATPLTGSRVFSDVQFLLNTDNTGHVLNATGSFNTRLLTLDDLGYVPTTLSGENYITAGGLENQTLTLSKIDLATQVSGILPASNISALALTTVQEASNEVAHLALTTQEGDAVVRSDENKSYIHNGGTAGTMADFTLLATPTDAVLSVNGATGVVTVGDVRLDQENTFEKENEFTKNVTFSDYAQLKFGNNLALYTDISNNSIITEKGAGDLLLLSNNELQIKSGQLGENFAKFTKDGPIELYYDNVKTFETTETGINVVGRLGIDGTTIIPTPTEINYLEGVTSNIQDQINAAGGGSSLTYELTGVAGGSNDYILGLAGSNGDLFKVYLREGTNINLQDDGANGVKITGTETLSGLLINGNKTEGSDIIVSDGDSIKLSDTSKVAFGNDFKISRDLGNNSIIEETGTGDLLLLSNNELEIKSGIMGENFAKFTKDGPIELYYDNIKRFETAANGITVTGKITATGDIIANYTSDKKFKDNVVQLDGVLDKVKEIRGVSFDWNDKQDTYKGHDIGVIAQEVEAVYPELVHYRAEDDSKAVDYVKLTAVLIEAVKELSAKVEALENNKI